jgi:hypothetical protein
MQLSVEAVVAIVALIVALPNTVLLLWSACRKRSPHLTSLEVLGGISALPSSLYALCWLPTFMFTFCPPSPPFSPEESLGKTETDGKPPAEDVQHDRMTSERGSWRLSVDVHFDRGRGRDAKVD